MCCCLVVRLAASGLLHLYAVFLFDNEVRLPKERYFYQGRCYNRLRKDELVPVQIRMG